MAVPGTWTEYRVRPFTYLVEISPGILGRRMPISVQSTEYSLLGVAVDSGTRSRRHELACPDANPLPLSEALLASRRPRALPGGGQSGLLAARSADLPARHRQLRHPVRQVHQAAVLPWGRAAPEHGRRRRVHLTRREELPGLLRQRRSAARRGRPVLRRHPALARAALPDLRGSAERRDAREAAEGALRHRALHRG